MRISLFFYNIISFKNIKAKIISIRTKAKLVIMSTVGYVVLMKKNVISSQYSWLNFRVSFPKEEKAVPWLSSLLDAYAMIDASVFMALETEKRSAACKKGCSLCCFHHIPLTYLELFGVQWFKKRKK